MAVPIASMSTSFLDWPSPDGFAVVLFFAGCPHGCPGCQSESLQSPSAGTMVEVDGDFAKFVHGYCVKNRTHDLVLSGGDPLIYAEDVQRLMDLLREEDASMRFCIYTGFTYEEASRKVHGFDFMKCGRYLREQSRPSSKTDLEMVLASPNQEIRDGCGRLLTRNGVMKFRERRRRPVI